MKLEQGEPTEKHGAVFLADAYNQYKAIELDTTTTELVRSNPSLVLRLTRLEGVPSLTEEQQAIVGRVEVELWHALDKMEPELARQTVDELAQWEAYGGPPLEADFTHEEANTLQIIANDSEFARAVWSILPGTYSKPPISTPTMLGDAVVPSPKYL